MLLSDPPTCCTCPLFLHTKCSHHLDGVSASLADLVDVYSAVHARASSVLMEERSGVLHLPQWAIEGTSSRYWSDCFISERQIQPWWMMDLNDVRLVTIVRVTTMRASSNLPNVRLDGMNGLQVVIANTSLSNGTDGVMCGRPWRYGGRDMATIRYNCRGALGRYVFIRLDVASPQYLALCEVVLTREKGKHCWLFSHTLSIFLCLSRKKGDDEL